MYKSIYALMSKLVPQPQLDVARGLSTILNCEPINSCVKSTLLPLSKSNDGSSRMILGASGTGAAPSSANWKIVSSSRTTSARFGSSGGGIVTKLMTYWKPWQPPDSTWMRRPRFGLASLVIIVDRRFAARGVISRIISLPSSSFKGFRTQTVAFLAGDAEKRLTSIGAMKVHPRSVGAPWAAVPRGDIRLEAHRGMRNSRGADPGVGRVAAEEYSRLAILRKDFAVEEACAQRIDDMAVACLLVWLLN